jgi:hypothetical protein
VSTVLRYDRSTVRADRQRLSTGAIRLTGELTKSGVFEYQDAAGQKFREWRPPEEVSKADSVATIEDLPVTIGHPRGGVQSESFSRLAVGHARGATVAKRGDGADVLVRGTYIVARKDAVDGVSTDKLTDSSMGYACRIENTPGTTPDGQRYDRIQRDIIYNHVALLPPGEARLGTRLDGNDHALRLDAAGNQIAFEDQERHTPMKVTIKQDGKDREVERGSDEHIAFLEAQSAANAARADANTEELTALRADAAKAARASLEETARGVLGKSEKFDGITDRQIREKVIAKRLPAVKCDGKSEVEVSAFYEAAVSVSAGAPSPKPRGSQSLVNALGGARNDAADPRASDDDEDDAEPGYVKKANDTRKKADSAWCRTDSKESN